MEPWLDTFCGLLYPHLILSQFEPSTLPFIQYYKPSELMGAWEPFGLRLWRIQDFPVLRKEKREVVRASPYAPRQLGSAGSMAM